MIGAPEIDGAACSTGRERVTVAGTAAVADDVPAREAPPAFVAISCTRIVWPPSDATTL